jgi:hypothetical protein
LFGGIPKKCKAAGISRCSRNCSPTIFSTIRRSRDARPTRLTTYKTYHGTHKGKFFGIAPTDRQIQFETVDVMRVRDGKITEHWGVANLFSLMQQLGALSGTPKA